MKRNILRLIYFIALLTGIYLIKNFGDFSELENKRSKLDAPLNFDAFDYLSNKDSINSRVRELFVLTGVSYIVDSNNDSLSIPYDSRNYDYEIPFLSSFLSKGDSLVKKHGSDSLIIIRNKDQYYFLLKDYMPE